MKRVFFYGLFMDAELLRNNDLHPILVGPASLKGYQLRIGTRATLVPDPESVAYGIVMDLAEGEVDALYSSQGVSDYVAENVTVALLADGSNCAALSYHLPIRLLDEKSNSAYAQQLAALVRRLGFPLDYADELQRQ